VPGSKPRTGGEPSRLLDSDGFLRVAVHSPKFRVADNFSNFG
jgi:hypothetical protein